MGIGRWWLAPVIGGAIWVAACGALLVALVAQALEENVPAVTMTTTEAMSRVEEDALPHVTLTDLQLDCEQSFLYRDDVHVLGHDADGRYIIVVQLDDGQLCEQSAVPSGRLGRPEEWHLSKNLRVPPDRVRDAATLEPAGVSVVMIVVMIGITALGVVPILLAARWRRKLLDTLAEIQAPSDPDGREAEPGADPILGRPVEIAPAFLRSLDRQVRWLRISRTGAGVLAPLLIASIGWVVFDRHQTWERGQIATDVELNVDIESEKIFVLHFTKVTALYTDQFGEARVGTSRNMSLFWQGDDYDATLRYRSSDPSRFVVSTILEQTPGTLLLASLCAAMLLSFAIWGPRDAPELSAERVAALRWGFVAVELEVAGQLREEASRSDVAATTYTLRDRVSGHIFDVRIAEPKPGPMFLDAAETLGLGLQNPQAPKEILLVRSDWSPLAGPHPRIADLQARWRAWRKSV